MAGGNQPIDGGHYLFSEEEKTFFIEKEPGSQKFFRLWLGADEFINDTKRWCLWLGNASPAELRSLPYCLKQVEAVRDFRKSSKRAQTRAVASTPTRFFIENIPTKYSLAIPEVSSENREYIPIGFMGPEVLCSNKLRLAPDATIYHFGIMTSVMHMAWTRTVTGRLESRFQYSIGIVYNNFPWPTPSDNAKATIEVAAQAVLDARAAHPGSSLADLYDPLAMPSYLRKAHNDLDRAVDAAYDYKGESDDASRCAYLFKLYEKLIAAEAAARPTKKATLKRCKISTVKKDI
jgi:hypothetical protein